MKKLRNNSGTALIWTVMVLGMLMIFSTTVLTIAMAYSKRTLNQNQNQQAYYTALSAVNVVAKQFAGVYTIQTSTAEHPLTTSNELKIINDLMNNPGKEIVIDDLHMPSDMGTVKVTMHTRPPASGGNELGYNDIVITADAEKNGETYRLSAILKSGITIIHPETPDSDYGEDGTPGLGAGGMNGGNGVNTDPDTDIYIWNNNDFAMDSSGRADHSIHMGALYTNGPINISCTIQGSSYTHLHGEIISTNNINLYDTATAGLLPSEFLTNGRTECCNNVDPSFIHTTGIVTMDEQSRMGGNITAKQINLLGRARVAGDLEADEVNIGCIWEVGSDGYTVLGNITANKVTITNSAVVVGDITANEVIISEQATVEGNINANKVTISTYEGDRGKVTGDVTAATVTMSKGAYIEGTVTANTLTMNDAAQIRSDANVNKIIMASRCVIGGTLSYYDPNSKITEAIGGRNYLTAPPAAVNTVPTLPPVTSQLPPKPSQPPIPPIPTDPPARKINSGGNISVGDPENDSYYTIEKNGINISNLHVDSEKNIFIFLPDGYEATVKEITDGTPTPPNVFFILGVRSKLNFGGDKGQGNSTIFPAYVWSRTGSGAQLDMDPGSGIEGGIWVDVVNSKQNNEYHWVPPDLTVDQPDPPDPPDTSTAPPDSSDPDNPDAPEPEDDVIVNWGIDAYENR